MTRYRFLVRTRRVLSAFPATLLLAAVLTACGSPAPAPSQPAAAQPPAATEAPLAPAAPTSAPAPTEAPAAAPTEAPVATTAPTSAPAATEAPATAPAASGDAASFSRDVMPIFEKSCIRCHGGENGEEGDLDLRKHADVMKGGKDGVVVVPADSANSMLFQLIDNGKMPRRAAKLPQEQIDLIARWIDEGALDN